LKREERKLEGRTVIGVELDGRFLGWIAMADELREGSREAVRRLQAMGIEPVVLSGDQPAAVARVAQALGIERWKAAVLPADKAAEVEALRRSGRRVGMAGDGV